MRAIEYLSLLDHAIRSGCIEKPAGIVLTKAQINELRDYFLDMGIDPILSQPFYLMGFTIFAEDL